MDWWLVTFFIGAIFSLLLPIVPAFFYVILFTLCFFFAFSSQYTRRYSALFLGCAWVLLIASEYQGIWRANKLDTSVLVSKTHSVTGKVETIPSCNGTRCRFNFLTTQFNNQVLTQPIRIRLRWDKPLYQPEQNQQWQLFVKLKPAHGLANPGSFSYQTWLRRYNIHATGYVKKAQPHQLISQLISHRQQQFTNFNKVLPNHYLSPIIQALTFGERSKLDKSHWQVLQNTQIQHLIAISGLHIGIIAGFSYLFFRLVFQLLPIQTLLYYLANVSRNKNSNKNRQTTFLLNTNVGVLALILSAACAGYYAYLAGFSVPTLRALVMIYWFLLMRLLSVKISVLSWLGLSLLLIVVLMPMSLISMSFWLSFYAVVCIFTILWRYKKYFDNTTLADCSLFTRFRVKSVQLLFLQLALTLLMLPLAALLSGQISFVTIFANIIAVPLISFIILPLSICAVLINVFSTTLAVFILNITLSILSWLWQYLTFLAELPWAVFTLSQLQWGILSLGVLLLIFTSILTTNTRKFLIIPFVLTLANVWAFTKESRDAWQVNVMDVGQGLAVVIKKNNHMLLYDTGASYVDGFSMAEAVLLPYFQQQGITVLDWLILSHDDNDHAGGFSLLNEKLVIDNIMTNDITIDARYRCLAGNKYIWQQLTIELLSPNQVKGDDNDDSCVVRISDQHHSVLLTGDIGKKVEQRLVNQTKLNNHQALKSDILIAPHHGSKTSSSHVFLKAVSPQYAIFSAGFLNHWHMPAKTVVERYQQLGIPTFKTADSGMVTLDITNKGIEVSRYRFDDWPYWFAN